MPSHLHELLIAMVHDRPALVADLLTGPLAVTVPEFEQARLSAAELPDTRPTEYRADAVVTLHRQGKQVLAVVVEVQLRADADKRFSWPVYVTTLRARLRCPVVLLVMCPRPRVAEWCIGPIVIGHPGFVMTPMVLGPRQVPVITDPEQATGNPELMVLSAIVHGRNANAIPVLEALLNAMHNIDLERAKHYTDLVFAALPKAARARLENLMATSTHPYRSEFARRYYNQGEAEGEVKALLTILDARGIEIPDDARAHITACTDVSQLDTWIRRAVTADKIQDVFD